jgi:hypothetical protein
VGPVKDFCRERGVSEPSFYSWRKRLAGAEPLRFALVDAGAAIAEGNAPMELILCFRRAAEDHERRRRRGEVHSILKTIQALAALQLSAVRNVS